MTLCATHYTLLGSAGALEEQTHNPKSVDIPEPPLASDNGSIDVVVPPTSLHVKPAKGIADQGQNLPAQPFLAEKASDAGRQLIPMARSCRRNGAMLGIAEHDQGTAQ